MATNDSGSGQQRATRRAENREATEDEAVEQTDVQERHARLSDDVDAMLDEIDSALEENAEDFVRSYVQKGGQ